MPARPLLVFADDWGRHPSSCQHLVRHLLPEHATTWVNTIGTRTPKFDLATWKRALGKRRQWFGQNPAAEALDMPAGLTVLNPRMWPWFTRRLDRRLNRALLLRQLEPAIRALPTPPVAVTTLPVVADLMGRLPVARWVYYCVDDFGQWPGLDQKTMGRLEEIVVARADVLIAAGETLRHRLATMGRESHLLTHGVDLDFWATQRQTIAGLERLERPLLVFWGLVDRRLDVPLLERLERELGRGSIVLTGPEQDPSPALARLRRVHRTGAMPIDELPSLRARHPY